MLGRALWTLGLLASLSACGGESDDGASGGAGQGGATSTGGGTTTSAGGATTGTNTGSTTTTSGTGGGTGGPPTAAELLAATSTCSVISTSGYKTDDETGLPANIDVCGLTGAVFWKADMDIDCDGGLGAVCMSDPDYMPDTSGVDSMGNPLDASTLPFIVIPLASSRFRYADYGIRTGTVALVLYGDQMVFGIFGDAGPSSILGEASFAMAEALGIPSSPRSGGVDSGVTYLVFTGTGTRVSRNEDHDEAVTLGTSLLETFMTP